MERIRLVSPGSFCWNQDCPDYGRIDHGNIRKFGRTQKGTQRYQCKTCKRTFVETRGTVFYRRHHSQETILECLALLAERNSLAAIHRVKGIKEETVLDWLREAAEHVEQIEALLLANYQMTRAQLDALWTYVGNKGEKGDMPSKKIEGPSGGEPRWIWTPACVSDERLAKMKGGSRTS
jgi:transposase-like protein